MLEHNKKVYEQQREKSDSTFEQGVPLIYNALNLDINSPDWVWEISSFSEDTKESTDIKITNVKTGLVIMVAYRMRTYGYIGRYPLDITFRYGNSSNVDSEFQKVMAGAAHVGLYGFTDLENNIIRWIVISFFGLRAVHHFDKTKGIYVPNKNIRQFSQQNKLAGDTSFVAYNALDFQTHDNNLITEPEDKIIMGTSPGYFEDIIHFPPTRKGVPGGFQIKDKIDRIDGKV